MVTHSSILAWRIPVDRGGYSLATVHGVAKSQTHKVIKHSTYELKCNLSAHPSTGEWIKMWNIYTEVWLF